MSEIEEGPCSDCHLCSGINDGYGYCTVIQKEVVVVAGHWKDCTLRERRPGEQLIEEARAARHARKTECQQQEANQDAA